MAVYIFYLISGYTVGYGFFSKKYTLSFRSLCSFYTNRFLRIAPAYYVCVFLSIFVFYPNIHTTAYDILRFFTFTANFDYLNLPFQQLLVIISTEMQFYLFAPILFLLLSFLVRKIHPLVIGAFILCLGIAIRYAMLSAGLAPDLSMYMLNVYVTVWGMIDYFLFGMFISYLVYKRSTALLQLVKRIPTSIYFIVFIGWFLWINYINFFPIPWQSWAINHLFLIPPSLCLVIGWYILSSGLHFTYNNRPVTASQIIQWIIHPKTFLYGIGIISYGLYLYHYVFFDLLYLKSGNIINTMPAFLDRFFTVFIVTIITALVSFRFIEYPFLRLKHKKT